MKIILLTGFEPFAGGDTNASWEAIKDLDGKVIAGHRILARRIPVVWGAPMKRLEALIEKHKPVAVFSFGQEFEGVFRFEKIARSERKVLVPDNLGKLPAGREVVKGGPGKYVSEFPIGGLKPAIERAGLPFKVSEDAGQYLCEETSYVLEHLRRTRGGFDCAFFHVPQVGKKIEVAGKQVPCDREILRGFVWMVVRAWIARPKAP